MGSIPAPNIAELGGQIAAAPMNQAAEYARVAALNQQTQQAQAMAAGQQQLQQQQIQAQQRQFADQDALTKAMTQFDPSKNSLADIPKLITSNGGSGQAALQAQSGLITQRQNLAKLSDDQFGQQQRIADLTQGVHDAVTKAAPEDKQVEYTKGLQAIAAAGGDVSKEPQQYPGDDAFAAHLPAIRLHSAMIAEAEKDREDTSKEIEAKAKQTTAEADVTKANASEWKDFPALGVSMNTRTGEQRSVSGGAVLTPDMMQAKYVSLAQKQAQGQPLDPSDAAWMKGYQKMKTLVPTANFNLQSSILSPEAQQMAAQNYAQTGQLPAGMRSPAMAGQVLNTAAGTNPGNIPNVAANKASYGADTASLHKLQTNFDNVTAFENTAGKNLDLFLNQAKNVVDSGSPWINKPLRAVDAGGLGSADQAAYNAARVTALTEIAKVLNSSNASGVLSDSARGEVEGLIGPNATLKQVVSAANILKQDMANRHQSYQQQIGDIQNRIKNPGGGNQNAQQTAAPQHVPGGQAQGLTEGQTGTGSNGKKYVVKNGVWTPQ